MYGSSYQLKLDEIKEKIREKLPDLTIEERMILANFIREHELDLDIALRNMSFPSAVVISDFKYTELILESYCYHDNDTKIIQKLLENFPAETVLKFVKKYNNTLKYKHMADVLSDEVERMERLLIKKLSHID
ncbi:hypothetical protein [uncultured Methanobrevibacter sp.]|uniref:hypothetical protein n=1 Tax=uncultured Methanobrevibacter sp. TaxID=253161 RepID=UPI0026390674|nr:hypothetical protein [uncultured Methanobrevibacter sp.]